MSRRKAVGGQQVPVPSDNGGLSNIMARANSAPDAAGRHAPESGGPPSKRRKEEASSPQVRRLADDDAPLLQHENQPNISFSPASSRVAPKHAATSSRAVRTREREPAAAAPHGSAFSTVTSAPTPAKAEDVPASGSRRRARRVADSRSSPAIALGQVRSLLRGLVNTEGVGEFEETLPEAVIIGSIAARRELVAALIGDSGKSQEASALLIQASLRQPLGLEFRQKPDGFIDEVWLQKMEANLRPTSGDNLSLAPFWISVHLAGCANIDVISLPDRSPVTPEVREMRALHCGCPVNLLVCLEPGPYLDMCYQYDPTTSRTLRVGAANEAVSGQGPLSTCGAVAAKELEERFAALVRERRPAFVARLEKMASRMRNTSKEARASCSRESPERILESARAAGMSFGRALSYILTGTSSCSNGALTLEEELQAFLSETQSGPPDGGGLRGQSPSEVVECANDLYSRFNGLSGYADYLKNVCEIPGAEVPLNGAASWQRLLIEIEVAVRLSHPPQEELASLCVEGIRCAGTSISGHQQWQDVARKLMASVSFKPLRRRVRYVVARVVWAIQRLKGVTSEYMKISSSTRQASPLFAEHLKILQSHTMVSTLLYETYDKCSISMGEQILKTLELTLMTACTTPETILLESTVPTPCGEVPTDKATRFDHTMKRVAAELLTRNSCSHCGLPEAFRELIFSAHDAAERMPYVEEWLRRAFLMLAGVLAEQATAFVRNCLQNFAIMQFDKALSNMNFSVEQRDQMASRHSQLEEMARESAENYEKLRRCVELLENLQ